MTTNFHLAPPPKTVDGLLAVPIDIETIDASFIFDGSTQTGVAVATASYTLGPTAGNPIFDLRQTISQAWVDGATFPTTLMNHHTFGSGTFTDLRVIETVQAANSVHTLRVQYPLALPNSQLGGSYLPAFDWLAGPRLRFVFGLSDLNKGRYAEAWLPANLIFDQYSINLELRIINTMVPHSVITNGAVTVLGTNHWQINFPDRFSALSPMLEIRASDTVIQQSDTVTLPVSGKTITIETWKPTGSTINLTTQINTIKSLLIDNENKYGAYLHENRFVAFFNGGGGMEYEGGTTTSTSALSHETFHSWYARGIKPASQSDGWWDEGFTTFHDDGANGVIPFDFSDTPILLCSRDPWQRNTPGNSYSDGSAFWKGIASQIGVSKLNALMGELYKTHKGNPVSTQMIEEFLLTKSGKTEIVDAFHRFVYGLGNPSPNLDLWIKDDPGHTGADNWSGKFWNSPDLWVRNADDIGMTHQSPEYGQDNWFYARVRNKATSGTAEHFVVTFHARGFVGTQFTYPDDFLPCIAAKAEFDLAPNETRIVKARWKREFVPPAGSHTCLLASVISRSDKPVTGKHVWEHNNLAQKNLVVVDLQPNTFTIIPIVIANWHLQLDSAFNLGVLTASNKLNAKLSILHQSKDFFRLANADIQRFRLKLTQPLLRHNDTLLDCGGYIHRKFDLIDDDGVLLSNHPELMLNHFADSWEVKFPICEKIGMPVEIPPASQKVIGLKVIAPPQVKAGQSITFDIVQRHTETKLIVGGVAIQVNVGGRQAHKTLIES